MLSQATVNRAVIHALRDRVVATAYNSPARATLEGVADRLQRERIFDAADSLLDATAEGADEALRIVVGECLAEYPLPSDVCLTQGGGRWIALCGSCGETIARETGLFSAIWEARRHAERYCAVRLRARGDVICPLCHGEGQLDEQPLDTCDYCYGTGSVPRVEDGGAGLP